MCFPYFTLHNIYMYFPTANPFHIQRMYLSDADYSKIQGVEHILAVIEDMQKEYRIKYKDSCRQRLLRSQQQGAAAGQEEEDGEEEEEEELPMEEDEADNASTKEMLQALVNGEIFNLLY